MKWCNDNDRITVTVSDESLPSVSNILLLCGLVNISISGIGGRLHWCIDGRCVQTDGQLIMDFLGCIVRIFTQQGRKITHFYGRRCALCSAMHFNRG